MRKDLDKKSDKNEIINKMKSLLIKPCQNNGGGCYDACLLFLKTMTENIKKNQFQNAESLMPNDIWKKICEICNKDSQSKHKEIIKKNRAGSKINIEMEGQLYTYTMYGMDFEITTPKTFSNTSALNRFVKFLREGASYLIIYTSTTNPKIIFNKELGLCDERTQQESPHATCLIRIAQNDYYFFDPNVGFFRGNQEEINYILYNLKNVVASPDAKKSGYEEAYKGITYFVHDPD